MRKLLTSGEVAMSSGKHKLAERMCFLMEKTNPKFGALETQFLTCNKPLLDVCEEYKGYQRFLRCGDCGMSQLDENVLTTTGMWNSNSPNGAMDCHVLMYHKGRTPQHAAFASKLANYSAGCPHARHAFSTQQ